jgi:hypothetical protein
VLDSIKILKASTLGVHDLLLNDRTIWKWQGNYYKRVKNLRDYLFVNDIGGNYG